MNDLVLAGRQALVQAAELQNPRRDLRFGIVVTGIFFVILLGGAALAPLDAGVRAAGTIAVSGNSQAVQHRDGGVVTAIHVREGQKVQQGQLLVEMAAPELTASERALTSDYLTLLAQRARLMAERAGMGSFQPPIEFRSLTGEDRELADQAIALQQSQMHARYRSLSDKQSVLGQRSAQLSEQKSGFQARRESIREQKRLISEELAGLKEVAAKGFVSTSRIRAMERAEADLRGQEAAMTAEMAKAGEGMGETRMQALSMRSSTQADIAQELRETQSRLSETLPKLVAAREQLQRNRIRAPATGQVVGLAVFTVGGVVAPGQTLMEVVPDRKALVVRAQVSPGDADDLYVGQTAQVRFSSIHDRTVPLVEARVKTVSADSFRDEKSGVSYFIAEVEVPRGEMDAVRRHLGRGQLRPGLPVEVIMAVRKRTALQYLLEPLTANFWRALREQ
ncbi:HlyD family type I secretion periplasmic adaptor subunit [Sphingomonas alba]|uniref:Membrane fusion protein (MFP) family protein n=1 Tax=Sphingomonas alba TaxID=2908208 RepID=A0ABT0RPL4_9SPHN|nr:HlyD family type I secretion periplasmic adaptor subunit [Sphingomonas alba]MCL6684535.1 HlyD family type I secretion periplasmic adaptor subunit [Sphingomonas alba]